MARQCECPKCGSLMELEEADPDVGIMASFWICFGCGVSELVEHDDEPEFVV